MYACYIIIDVGELNFAMILGTRDPYMYVCKAGLMHVVHCAWIEYYMYIRGLGKNTHKLPGVRIAWGG